jgi:hypothetical protein
MQINIPDPQHWPSAHVSSFFLAFSSMTDYSLTQMRQAFTITKICYAAGKCKDNRKSSTEDFSGLLVDVQDARMFETKKYFLFQAIKG